MKINLLSIVSVLLLITGSQHVSSAPPSAPLNPTKNQEHQSKTINGPKLYIERCMLCHGLEGYGDGFLAIKIEAYPEANLLAGIKAKSRKSIRKAIFFGGTVGELSSFMPPFGEELTGPEVDALIDLIQLMRHNVRNSSALLQTEYIKLKPSFTAGKNLFSTRCVLCHGKSGLGDGRMAAILKNPPPSNLSTSKKSDEYIYNIINLGGKNVGRSEHMPPWGDQLTYADIQSLILYLKTLRESNN